MNSHYRKIIYKTRQARNNYNKNKTSENWKTYTKWRNTKTKTKRESISVCFQERGTQVQGLLANHQTFLVSEIDHKK